MLFSARGGEANRKFTLMGLWLSTRVHVRSDAIGACGRECARFDTATSVTVVIPGFSRHVQGETMKRTYQPSKTRRKRTHGFRVRMKTKAVARSSTRVARRVGRGSPFDGCGAPPTADTQASVAVLRERVQIRSVLRAGRPRGGAEISVVRAVPNACRACAAGHHRRQEGCAAAQSTAIAASGSCGKCSAADLGAHDVAVTISRNEPCGVRARTTGCECAPRGSCSAREGSRAASADRQADGATRSHGP